MVSAGMGLAGNTFATRVEEPGVSQGQKITAKPRLSLDKATHLFRTHPSSANQRYSSAYFSVLVVGGSETLTCKLRIAKALGT